MKSEKTDIDINEAFTQLDANLKGLDESIEWALSEIRRLRAENIELQLRNDNLLYMLRHVTQGEIMQ